jgi:cholesterol transport system auxiliary component
MTNRLKPALTAAALALPLSACLGLSGPKPPPTLFTLSAPEPAELPSRSAKSGATITVVVPTVPAALQSPRIPVRISPTEYAWLKDGQWVEQPNSLFQRLVSEAITARTRLVVLDPRQTTHDPGQRLTGQLADFGLDTTAPGGPVAKVRYDATITLSDGSGVATRRFEVSRPSSDNPRAVARALNDAANEVATQVADWIGAV